MPWFQCNSSSYQYCIQPHIEAIIMYHQLYMIDSCILEHISNYSFDIVTRMGMPASSIYMSHIIFISPIDGNHINTKTKSHHAPCNVPGPLTGEEDATMALTIRAKSPMNMYIHENDETKCFELEHAYMNIFHKAEANIHSYKHSTCSSHSLTKNMIAEVKWTRSLILRRTQSATSYVTVMFHPTIGQCAP